MSNPGPREPTLLLRRIQQIGLDFERALGRRLDVNPTDLLAMQHLMQSGPLGPSELARRLEISTAATTAVVDRLTAVGHARREQNPTDRRSVVVVPEPGSVEVALGVIRPMARSVDGVLDAFDGEQQAVIADYLRRVVEAYAAAVPVTPEDEPDGSSA
jgi:DNA-binding MarR family transcriptional regulator